MRAILIAMTILFAVSACGKKAPLRPPEEKIPKPCSKRNNLCIIFLIATDGFAPKMLILKYCPARLARRFIATRRRRCAGIFVSSAMRLLARAR